MLTLPFRRAPKPVPPLAINPHRAPVPLPPRQHTPTAPLASTGRPMWRATAHP